MLYFARSVDMQFFIVVILFSKLLPPKFRVVVCLCYLISRFLIKNDHLDITSNDKEYKSGYFQRLVLVPIELYIIFFFNSFFCCHFRSITESSSFHEALHLIEE